jgi:hypothetical protein
MGTSEEWSREVASLNARWLYIFMAAAIDEHGAMTGAAIVRSLSPCSGCA